MEHTENTVPSFEQRPSYVAGIKNMLDSVIEKLDTLIDAPGASEDAHTVLDIKEASELVGKTVGTLYTLTSAGAIPFSKRGNKLYFFRDELLAWIKAGGKTDTDFRTDENREAYDRHLIRLREAKRRKPGN